MEANKILKKNLLSFFIVTLVFLSDRITKYIILKLSNASNELDIFVSSFLSFNLIWNNGIAFGLLQFKQSFYYNLITIVICLITLIVIWLAYKSEGLEKNCYLIIGGGAFGNLFDRVYYGSVIDFIDISNKNYHWFIFNVADIFISIGILMLIILELIKKKS